MSYPPGSMIVSTIDGMTGIVQPWRDARLLIPLDSRFESTPPKEYCYDCCTTNDGYVCVLWEDDHMTIQDVRFILHH